MFQLPKLRKYRKIIDPNVLIHKFAAKMIRSQPVVGTLPDCQKELKGWKDKFEMNNLNQIDIIQFFQTISPHLLTVEPKSDPNELGIKIYP